MQRRLFSSALALTVLGATMAAAAPAAAAVVVDEPIAISGRGAPFSLVPLDSYDTGEFDVSAAEIVAFVPEANRILAVNALSGSVDVLDAADPTDLSLTGAITVAGVTDAQGTTIPEGSAVNSVAVRADGLAVLAVENAQKTAPGWAVIVDAAAETPAILGAVRVGAQPDNVSLSPDGAYAVTPNEGEPNEDYTVDPQGTVSVISLPQAVAAPGQDAVSTADFTAYDAGRPLPDGVLVYGASDEGSGTPPTSPIAQNLEPEYAAVDETTAYVTLQENNAIAVLDLATAQVTGLLPLGTVDHGLPEHALDPSDRDGRIDVHTFPGLRGVHMPDGIVAYEAGGATYLVTANEGDAREFGEYEAAARVKNLATDGRGPVCDASPLAGRTADDQLGRLNVLIDQGLSADGSCYEELHALGSRSLSIWTASGEKVFDSGRDIKRLSALYGEFFNSNHSESNFEGRSDDKGAEPENLDIGRVGERTYAFVGLERLGGLVVYDITDPANATFVTHVNNRDFSISMEDSVDAGRGEADLARVGDLGAEGVDFVPAEVSPTNGPLVIVGNEVSGTTTAFAVSEPLPEPEPDVLISTERTTTADLEAVSPLGEGDALAGDWDGDGVTTVGQRAGNRFVLSNDNLTPGADHVFTFGRAGDQVVVGDWDGDGTDTVGVRRGNRVFTRDDHAGGEATRTADFGRDSDAAFAGDWDGDGADTLGVRRGAQIHLTYSADAAATVAQYIYGRAGDLPVVGDWDGDGADTVSVRRGNRLLLTDELAGGAAAQSITYGRAGDVLLTGAFDGERDSWAVYRRVD